jgi:hypothetical protein
MIDSLAVHKIRLQDVNGFSRCEWHAALDSAGRLGDWNEEELFVRRQRSKALWFFLLGQVLVRSAEHNSSAIASWRRVESAIKH